MFAIYLCQLEYNQKTNNHLLSIQGQTLEGRLSHNVTTEEPKLLSAGDIYQLSPNNHKYKLIPQPYLIDINHATSVTKLEDTIPKLSCAQLLPLQFQSASTLSHCYHLPSG